MKGENLGSLVAMCLWLLPFVAGIHLRLGATVGRRSWLSASAGISIAYVFMDLLPQMSQMQEVFSAAAVDSMLPFPHFRVYTAATIGFVVFYVLENMMVFSRAEREEREKTEEAALPIYWIHLLGFTLYCGTMSYFLHEESRRNVVSLALYSLALFLHFWTIDHSLREEHGRIYDRSGRWVIALGIAGGWALGLLGLSSDFILPTLLGFVGGGVVINSIKEELPGKGEGRALPFVIGTFGYGLLILLIELEAFSGAR